MTGLSILYFALSVVLVSQRVYGQQQCDGLPVVISPEVVVPGKDSSVLLTLSSSRDPLNITVHLIGQTGVDGGELIAKSTHVIPGMGIIPFHVPPTASGGPALLQVSAACNDDTVACPLLATRRVTIAGPIRDAIIHTDRQIYSPGDTVSFWIVSLDWRLRPTPIGGIRLSVDDPVGTRVALWEELTLSPEVSNFSVALSPFCREGRWRIVAEVDGMMFIGEYNVSRPEKRDLTPEIPVVEAHFVQLRFGSLMRKTFKQGLPFVGKVEAASSEKILRIRVRILDNGTAIFSQDVEVHGWEAPFEVPAIMTDSEIVVLQAELISVNGRETDQHYVLASEVLVRHSSPTRCQMVLKGLETTLKPNDVATVTILSSCECDQEWYYAVTTEGSIDQAGTTSISDNTVTSSSSNVGCTVNFSFPVRSEMAPVSHVMVYSLVKDEIVSDTQSFDVNLVAAPLIEVPSEAASPGQNFPLQPLPLSDEAPQDQLLCVVAGQASEESSEPAGRLVTLQSASTATNAKDVERAGLMSCGDTRAQKPLERGLRLGGIGQIRHFKCEHVSPGFLPPAMTVTAPDDGGLWTVWGISLSPQEGLRISSPLWLKAEAPINIRYHLPRTFQVGEVTEVEITITSQYQACLDVTALLTLSSGLRFHNNGLLFLSEQLRLGPDGATVLVVHVEAVRTGPANVTAQVSGYTGEGCGENEITEETAAPTHPVGVVTQTKTTYIIPEGVGKRQTQAAYFCANEHVALSAPEDASLLWAPGPLRRRRFVVWVRAGGEVHITLGKDQGDTKFTLVLGGEQNSRSWLQKGMQGYGVRLATSETPQLLSSGEFRPFWVSWERNELWVGVGTNVKTSQDALLSWKAFQPSRELHTLAHVAFSSAFGTNALFRLWREDEESGFSHVFHLDFPPFPVPGTEEGSLLVSGGFTIPSPASLWMEGSEITLEAPTFAAALQAIFPILHWGTQSAGREATDTKVLQRRLQDLLRYRREDGAFGEHEDLPSLKGTVTSVEALYRMQGLVAVEPRLISGSRHWILMQQNEDGSFREALPTKRDTSVNDIDAVITTSEALLVLLLTGVEEMAADWESERILRGRFFLEHHLLDVGKDPSPLALAVTTLTLLRTKSSLADTAMTLLRTRSRGPENTFAWDGDSSNSHETTVESVERALAALWALEVSVESGDLQTAESAARWIAFRSPLLEHLSVVNPVAWRATARFAQLADDHPRALTLSLATSGMELTDTMTLGTPGGNFVTNNNKNKKNQDTDTAPRRLRLPSLPTRLFIYATGAGCATMQSEVSYSTYAGGSGSFYDLTSEVESEAAADIGTGQPPTVDVRVCIRAKTPQAEGLTRLEMRSFSGYTLDSLGPVGGDEANVVVLKVEARDEKIWVLLAHTPRKCALCLKITLRHVYTVRSLRPALARVYAVGHEQLSTEKFFHGQHGGALRKDALPDDWTVWVADNRTDGTTTTRHSEENQPCFCNETCTTDAYNVTTPTVPPDSTTPPVTPTVGAEEVDIPTSASPVTATATTEQVLTTTTAAEQSTAAMPMTTAESQPQRQRKERVNESLPLLPTAAQEVEGSGDDDPSQTLNKAYYVLDGQTLWTLLRDAVRLEVKRLTTSAP